MMKKPAWLTEVGLDTQISTDLSYGKRHPLLMTGVKPTEVV